MLEIKNTPPTFNKEKRTENLHCDFNKMVDSLNPSLMQRKITLENGIKISANQYLKEFAFLYFPTNGRITLKNGVTISTKQYIEEIFLNKIDEYKDDAKKLIHDTTASTSNPKEENKQKTTQNPETTPRKNLMDIYNQITNPLEDKDALETILKMYSESDYLYNAITHRTTSETTNFTKTEQIKFYINSFNSWRENILNLNDNLIEFLEKNGYPETRKIQTILKKIEPAKSAEDINKIFESEDIYFHCFLSDIHPWIHTKSKYLNSIKEKSIEVKHRLYINCSNIDLHKIANLFIEKCNSKNIPFYFKFSPDGVSREDKIVIYSDTKNLLNYINILNEIKKDNTDIIQRIGKPPMLVGQIDGWIGIADEPKQIYKKEYSFNELVSEILEGSIQNTIIKNIYSFGTQKKEVKINNHKIKFNDYFVDLFIEELIKDLNKKLKLKYPIKNMGVDINDLSSDKFKEYLSTYIRQNIKKILITKEVLKIPTKNNGAMEINYDFSLEIIKKTIPIIIENNSNLYKELKQEILNNLKLNGFDENKPCLYEETQEEFAKHS